MRAVTAASLAGSHFMRCYYSPHHPYSATPPMPKKKTTGVPVQKTAAIWKRSIKVNFVSLAAALGKGVVAGTFGNWEGLSSSGIDTLAALGLEPNNVETIAWVLVQRSLLQVMSDLTKEFQGSLPVERRELFNPNFKQLCEQLDLVLKNSELVLNPDFFKHPEELSIVKKIQAPFRRWLQVHEVAEGEAHAMADRIPRYFVFALNDQWRANFTDYKPLIEQLNTPFTQATERELAWIRYKAWLQKRIDEPMFAEAFSFRQVYVPLRAYYERTVKSNNREKLSSTKREKEVERIVTDLEAELVNWVNRGDKDDAIRVICGGPGSGKSSFTRMFAATIAERDQLPVLFIPLHELDDLSRDLVDTLSDYIKKDLDDVLPPNPLERDNAIERVLLIFDGLDELSMQGKVAAQVAQDFVLQVQRKLNRFNENQTRVMALLSSREIVVQANRNKFPLEGQILHVLPYYQTEEERKKHTYIDKEGLLEQDQRQVWWQTYGKLKARNYEGLPQELDRGNLVELTAQPLLNYLVALSYDRGKLNFAKESNLNAIYADLLEQVYQRDWERYRHPALGSIELKDFISILEEIAIACWHGNSRTTTVNQIEQRCASDTLKRILGIFEGSASEGVTRLLTAFYFQQSGIHGSEAAFEFTHKSFGEYLTARHIVLELRMMQEELTRYRSNSDRGWNEKECLKRWAILCGPNAMDTYLLSFLKDEIKLQDSDQVRQWQQMLCELINCMLRHGMPMEQLNPRPKYIDENNQARNAGEALLAALSSCAWITKELSTIGWPNSEAFGTWLSTMQGQRTGPENPIAFSCLNHLNLSECTLYLRDLYGANLSGANLDGTDLCMANLDGANLSGASLCGAILTGASLYGANLSGASLYGATLSETGLQGASLQEATLTGASLYRANLTGANLQEATLNGADLQEAMLNEACLTGASLTGTSLYGASLDRATLNEACLTGVSLDGASLNGASLKRANLGGACLFAANLGGANLGGVCLFGATLAGANLARTDLRDISWDEDTHWSDTQGAETARNVPESLKQQLGLT